MRLTNYLITALLNEKSYTVPLSQAVAKSCRFSSSRIHRAARCGGQPSSDRETLAPAPAPSERAKWWGWYILGGSGKADVVLVPAGRLKDGMSVRSLRYTGVRVSLNSALDKYKS